MTRAIIPLVALLALIALVISSFASLSTILSLEPGTGTAACRLGPLRADMRTNYHDHTVIISYVIQPPNPCYRVESIAVRQNGLSGNEAAVTLLIKATGPGPGKMCVQVLPPPVTGEAHINVPEKPSLVRINMELTLVLDNGSVEHYSCTALIKNS